MTTPEEIKRIFIQNFLNLKQFYMKFKSSTCMMSQNLIKIQGYKP
ncbi:MAG: hypothetical protein KatS3mg046_096 [Bellilinea sp.]|nr:MAG: hypothetical protein KatS3mg046_096 [Bellilinea sp.]